MRRNDGTVRPAYRYRTPLLGHRFHLQGYAARMAVPPDTARLRFREMTAADLQFMAGLLGDERVMEFYPRAKSPEEVRAWIEWNRTLYRTRGFGLWLIELAGAHELVGDCGITPQVLDGVEEIELGYHVHPDFQGRGFATEAAAAVLMHARSVLGQRRVVAIIDPRNEPSQRVARRVGLSFEKATLWQDKSVAVFACGSREPAS